MSKKKKKQEKNKNSGITKEVVKEKETSSVDDSFINNKEKEKMVINKAKEIYKEKKEVKHPLVHSFLVLVLFTSLAYFIVSLFYKKTDSLVVLINSLLLVLFTLLFVAVAIKTNKKNKMGFFLSSFILFLYFGFGILMNLGIVSFPDNKVIDFRGKKLTEVIEWSEKNSINIIQDYEYSDMVDEYHIISQDVEAGTKIKDVQSITVAVSEGPSPSKEIVVPNMVSWKSERVMDFIKKNHLSNVIVDFVLSSKEVDTVIEQSKSGNLRRDEELKLVFSYGEVLEYEEVKLIDFTGKSKFEAMFYLKQHHLNYEFTEEFSKTVKKGLVVKQSIKAGSMVKVDDEKIVITISKGPEIKVPDLKKMSMSEITTWVIENKLKLEFTDKYDDTVKENSVISANYKQGDTVAEGDVIKVVISRGKLRMQKFDSYDEFREWADKYGVKYEEQHQFSSTVAAGGVISYSYDEGATIKNNDSVIVIISDGKEAEVPNVVGSTKSQASSKLTGAGFRVNFVYDYSNSVAEGKVIRQSIGGGSKVAQAVTITLTISKGKKPASGGSAPTQPPAPTCDTSKGAVFWAAMGNTGVQVFNATKNQNPGFTIVPTYVKSCPNGATTSGMVCSMNINEGDWVSYCTTIRMTIVE